MTDETNSDDGLFVTDAEMIRRWGLPEKVGRRVLRELEKTPIGRPRFPQKDQLFGDRRFYPAVLQWLCDYFNVGQRDRIDLAGPEIPHALHFPSEKTGPYRSNRHRLEKAR